MNGRQSERPREGREARHNEVQLRAKKKQPFRIAFLSDAVGSSKALPRDWTIETSD